MVKKASSSLPEKGGTPSMWKRFAKELNFPESYVSITLGFLVVIIGGVLLYNYFTRQGMLPTQEDEKARQEATNQTREGTHTVSQNDSLWSISEKYYGTGYNWPKLAQENKLEDPNHLESGTTLVIPTIAATEKQEDILAESTQQPRSYTVIRGDSLWKIAVSQYNDGYAWVRIAKENNLTDPNIIHPGNVLKVP